jgi:hypothetical protein
MFGINIWKQQQQQQQQQIKIVFMKKLRADQI